MTNCPRCGSPTHASARDCQTCGEPIGYPNVRIALEERHELIARHIAARNAAASYVSVFDDFEDTVKNSVAVIARSLAIVQQLLTDDHAVYTTYQKQIAEGSRVPQNNIWDETRTTFEAWLFPNYHEEIRFGCLSLDGRGASGYGDYTLILKDTVIAHRATVFEENPAIFANKHRIILGSPVPKGYRAIWDQRQVLAVTKLYPDLNNSTKKPQYSAILLKDNKGTGNSDFIEVHIYGPINKFSVAKLIGPAPRTVEDKVLFKRLKNELTKSGVVVETL